jgi:glyceraldehyde-3-phosphate dehydrogenase (NAD(P))
VSRRIVHVVGTGTIGEPLIGLFCHFARDFGIDEVTYHKRTPLSDERPKVESLARRGARLCVDADQRAAFERMGHKVHYEAREAIARATIVVDCTPSGNDHRAAYLETPGPRVFMAQGSAFGFGRPYARGINDETVDLGERFVQIVSCNTHNICVLLKTLGADRDGRLGVRFGQFVCMRRATDISQARGFLPAPEVGLHRDERFGTHHARDAWRVFQSLGHDLDLFSSAVRLPTQHMHTLHFAIGLESATTAAQVVERLAANPRVARTEKRATTLVFSFGRDHGFYGRILNETVVPTSTLHVTPDGRRVTGFCFTPQDGNSLLSTVACTLWYLYGEDPWGKLEVLRPFMFDEI